jgi:hypothetical protein
MKQKNDIKFTNIYNHLNNLVLQKPTVTPEFLNDFNGYVKTFITLISNVNAATPIGTVLFTDSVAKNFVEVNTCLVVLLLNWLDLESL